MKVRLIIAREQPLVRDDQIVGDPLTGKPVRNPAIARAASGELAAIRKQRDDLLDLEEDVDIVRMAEDIARRAAADRATKSGEGLGGCRDRVPRPSSPR